MFPDGGIRRFFAVVLIAICAMHHAEAASIHLTEAQMANSASQGWMPPDSLNDADAADTALLNSTDAWQTIQLPHAHAYRFLDRLRPAATSKTGPEVIWYRLQLPASALHGPSNHLYMPRWQTVGTSAVYVDGRLLWRTRGDREWNNFNQPLWLDIGSRSATGAVRTVHLRMAGHPGAGSALSSLWAGPTAELDSSWRLRNFLQTDLVSYWRGSFVMLGFFSLAMALWLRFGKRQRNPSGTHEPARPFALFFCMAMAQMLSGLLYLDSGNGLGMDFSWFSWMTLAALLGVINCGFHFLCQVQGHARPRLARALNRYCVLVVIVALPWWWPAHSAAMPLLRLALLPPVLLVVWVTLSDAWRLRNRPSLLLGAWGITLIPLAAHDLAMQAHRLDIEGIYLTPYANVGLLTLFLYLAFTRYTAALDTAGRARIVLTDRLSTQERELVRTHERLRVAEREQTLMQERQRLMREMHDGVGSSLISALRLVEGKRNGVDVAQVLRECIDDLKIAIDSLEPAESDLLSLLGALRFRLGRRLSDAGIALHWRMSAVPPLPWLDPQAGLHILRILQEIFTNIAKHSGANEIIVSAEPSPSPTMDGVAGVGVRVEDNGSAFAPPALETLQPGRRGLANVQARMRALGAEGGWRAGENGGTCFSLWLPLEHPAVDVEASELDSYTPAALAAVPHSPPA